MFEIDIYVTLTSLFKRGRNMNKPLIMTYAAILLTSIGVLAADDKQNIVFITSASFNSNLGGLKGADQKCQAEADDPASIVPSGTYLAWLSDDSESPDTRFTKSSHPYVLPDETRIAEDYADLTDGSILHTINLGSTGQSIAYQQYWTGTNADGTASQSFLTCNGWMGGTKPGAHGSTGHTAKKSSLWSSLPDRCDKPFRLACFQQ